MSTNLELIFDLYKRERKKHIPEPLFAGLLLSKENAIEQAENYQPPIGQLFMGAYDSLFLKWSITYENRISFNNVDKTQQLAALAEYIALVDTTKANYHQAAIRLISDRYIAFWSTGERTIRPIDVTVLEDILLEGVSWNNAALRTGFDCSTCGNKWLSNPVLEAQEQAEKKSAAWKDLGASTFFGGVGAHKAIRQIKKAGKSNVVCPSCKGLEHQERLVTYCAGCKNMRTEGSLLKPCKCGFVVLDETIRKKPLQEIYDSL